MSTTIKPFSWVVRFDVAPLWVQDGFTLTDERLLEMLSRETCGCMSTELAARVLAAPSPLRIAKEQGYGPKTQGSDTEILMIMGGAPHAYADMQKQFKGVTLDKAITDAIKLLDSVAFVRDEKDNTQEVLANLRAAQALIRGDEPISDIDWQPSPD